MATSPTVLASASTSSNAVPVPVSAATKLSILPTLLAVVAGAMIAALSTGGVVYYIASTGRLPMQGKAAQKTEAGIPIATHAMALEPFLVNLADSSGSSYLRVALTLRVANITEKKEVKAKDEKSKDDKSADEAVSAVRDTVLAVLGQQTADDLLASDGKKHLKTELKTALAQHNTDLKVTDVFFTDFLVQR